MNIVIIAYSFSPFGGSEEAIGWNIAYQLSKYNKVFVFTKNEHYEEVSKYLKDNPNNNLEVNYVTVPEIYKKIYKGPFYSGRLNIFLKKTSKKIVELLFNNDIDIIHQVNPVEFRSICCLKNKGNAKYVVGPAGGGEYIPKQLNYYLSFKEKIIEIIRKVMNFYSKCKYKILNYSKYIDKVYCANNETAKYLSDCFTNIEVKTEIGIKEISENIEFYENDVFTFICVGRLIYRKGHKLLLDAIANIDKNKKFKVIIIGNGSIRNELEDYANMLQINDKVTFVGNKPYNEVGNYYRKSNAFIMPSLRETTGTVVLEALSYGLPIITSNKYGASLICNAKNSLFYDLNKNKNEIIYDLSNLMVQMIDNKVIFDHNEIIDSIETYKWDVIAKDYYNLYVKLISE